MLLVADVHGDNQALARVARLGEPLLVLGDLLNLVDYRTGEGLLADLFGRDLVLEVLDLRRQGGLRRGQRAVAGVRRRAGRRRSRPATTPWCGPPTRRWPRPSRGPRPT